MAQQVQFHNKLWLGVLLTAFVCSCRNAPLTKINMSDSGFNQRGELLFYCNQPFTGASYELYPNGDTARYVEYADGKQNGILKWWYPNKQLAQLRYFVDGKKQGTHQGWWPDGKPKFMYQFTDDEHNGELKEWNVNGRLFRFFHYKMGHEEGSEKMWWDDGKVRANYVIINGEKFGLFGQKLCSNTLRKKAL